MKTEHTPMTEFFNLYGDRLVNVNGENAETGWFRLMESEKDRAKEYQDEGYEIATVWMEGDGEREETVSLEFENSREHPFVTGYLILEAEPTIRINKSDLKHLNDLMDDLDSMYNEYLERYVADHPDECGEDADEWDEPPLDKTDTFYNLYHVAKMLRYLNTGKRPRAINIPF
jgi:hypothetical protein